MKRAPNSERKILGARRQVRDSCQYPFSRFLFSRFLDCNSHEAHQYHKKRTQDAADAADQYYQPAIADAEADHGIGQKENHQSDNGVDDKVLYGSQYQESAEDDNNDKKHKARFDHS
jgi:hypothetical protein